MIERGKNLRAESRRPVVRIRKPDTAAAVGDYRGAWDMYKMSYAEAIY